MKEKNAGALKVLLPSLLAIGLLIAMFSCRPGGHAGCARPGRPEGTRNVRNLTLLLAYSAFHRSRWPEYSGPAFVLFLVAKNAIDARRRDNLRTLWIHGEFPEGLDFRRYDELTPETLRTGDVSGLTSAAGRRNLDPRYRLTEVEPNPPEPILGWRHGRGAVLGYSDGSVRYHTRKSLGLDGDDPIVFGEASKSDLLRPLSED